VLAGLVELLVCYLAGYQSGGMRVRDACTSLLGFGLMVLGLIMTMRWR